MLIGILNACYHLNLSGLLLNAYILDDQGIYYYIAMDNVFLMTRKSSACERCLLKRYSDRNPASLIAKIWKWHTGWCPGWKAYQKSLQENS